MIRPGSVATLAQIVRGLGIRILPSRLDGEPVDVICLQDDDGRVYPLAVIIDTPLARRLAAPAEGWEWNDGDS